MTTSTAPAPPALAGTHEHGWVTLSAHVTSAGTVRYVRCTVCAALRVDGGASPSPPVPLSRTVRAPAAEVVRTGRAAARMRA